VLERLLLARLRPNSKNFSKRQSAYWQLRQGHLTEAVLLDVLDSVHTAADSKEVTFLIGLDLSAAFDTVCHSTLTKRLQTEFGVSGTALSWIQSYLQDRTQFVKLGQHRSSETTLEVGVPQGYRSGPLLFAVYCSPVADVIASHGIRCHQYADDTQLHLAMRVNNTATGLSIHSRRLYHRRQAVVHAEWAPTESRQVRSALIHRHSHTAESGVIFDVSISRGCRVAGGGLDASSWRHSRSSPDFR